MKAKTAVVFLLALAWTGVGLAQEMQPVTTVANFHVKMGKEQEFRDLIEKVDAPIFEQLMADGKVLAWGLGIPVMHEPGRPTHGLWWTSPSMAEMDAVIETFEAHEKKIMEEDPEFFARIGEMTDMSKHYDACFRDLVFGSGTPPAEGARPYTWIFTAKVKPGQEKAYMTLWTEFTKPMLDKLVSEGTVHAYGLSIQEIKRTDAFTHFTWISVPNFAGYEKARSAYVASRENLAPEQRQKLADAMETVFDPDASRTIVLREEIFHVARSEQ